MVVSRITTVWWTGIFVVMMTGEVSGFCRDVACNVSTGDGMFPVCVGTFLVRWGEWLFVPVMGWSQEAGRDAARRVSITEFVNSVVSGDAVHRVSTTGPFPEFVPDAVFFPT